MVVGILALIFYNDLSVREYFARINGKVIITPVSTPAPITPAPSVESQVEELSAPVDFTTPEPTVDPEKPKRIRKIAGK